MLILALALGAADLPPAQILGGPPFEAFAAATERRCAKHHFRTITPADMDLMQQTFEDQLPPPARRRLSANDHAQAKCGKRNGLSCPVVETLGTYRRAGVFPAFVSYACVHGRP